MESTKYLGELLTQHEIVNQEAVNDALRIQVSGNRRLGHILLLMGALSEDQLAKTLSQQLNIPLTNVDEKFSEDVKQILPRYLCTKYGVLPLSLKDNNILLTAMADPSDQEAITDIEHYTGKVVEPCLAMLSNINHAVPNKIPYSLKDIFNPQVNTKLTRIIATAAHLSNATIYEHHDLMLGFDTSGKGSLLGHSAFSDGYYSVEFNNINELITFIKSRKKDFSVKQNKWLKWVLNKR